MLTDLFQYTFFTNALEASLLISILCGLAGTWIVARRLVFIAGGITHASFGGIGLGYFLGLNPLIGAAVFAVASANGMLFATRKGNLREDSAIGILWSLGMALGVLFIFLTPGYAPNLMTYLFGSLLTVGSAELNLMWLLAGVVVVFFALFYRVILTIAFDDGADLDCHGAISPNSETWRCWASTAGKAANICKRDPTPASCRCTASAHAPSAACSARACSPCCCAMDCRLVI